MQEALLLFLRVSTGSGIILWKTVNCTTTVHKYLVRLYPSLTAPQGTPPSPVWIHIDSCLNSTNVSFRCWSSESSPFLCRELQQDPGIWGEWKRAFKLVLLSHLKMVIYWLKISLHISQWTHQAEAYPGFCNMNRLGTFLPPIWDASPSQGYL